MGLCFCNEREHLGIHTYSILLVALVYGALLMLCVMQLVKFLRNEMLSFLPSSIFGYHNSSLTHMAHLFRTHFFSRGMSSTLGIISLYFKQGVSLTNWGTGVTKAIYHMRCPERLQC